MSLPIRRATPQPRTIRVRPQRIAPAAAAAPQAAARLAIRGKVWIPRPRITSSRRVVPAPLGAPQAAAQFAKRGHVWIPRPRITSSRRVIPAAAASPQASAVFARLGVKRGPTKPLRSRLVLAAPALIAPPAIRAAQGIKRGPTKNRSSHLVAPAPVGSPQAKGVQVRSHVWIRRPQVAASRLIIPAPALAAQPIPATLPLRGARRPTGKSPRARSFVAPLGSPQPAATRIGSIRRSPVRTNRSRSFIGASPLVATSPAAILHGMRWAPIRRLRSRLIAPASLSAPQAASRLALSGIHRIHPKRPPLPRLFLGPARAPATGLRFRIDSLESAGVVSSAQELDAIVSVEPSSGIPSIEPGQTNPSVEPGSSVSTQVRGS